MTRTWLVLALAVVACGDNLQPREAGSPTVRIEQLPVSIAPGAPLAFRVAITGDVDEHELVVGIQQPGDPLPPDGPRFSQPGIAPATGAITYLAEDGTLGEAEVTLAPSSRDVVLTLPDVRGEVRVFAGLRAGVIRDADERAVIVTDGVALRVSADKRWIDLRAPVRIATRVAPPEQAEALAILAWLTLPDGRTLALPELTPEVSSATVGSYGEAATLLDRDLEVYGPGNYRVAVRLFDPESGELRGAGGAGFTVCAEKGVITGSVRDQANAPLGADASIAVVVLRPIDGGVDVAVPIDNTGSYRAEVPVGRWLVRATVADAAGIHPFSETPIVVGCEAPQQLDFIASQPFAATLPPAPPRRAVFTTSPAEDPISIRAEAEIRVGSDDMRILKALDIANTWYAKVVSAAEPDVEFVSNPQINMVLANTVVRMQLGTDSVNDVEATKIAITEFNLFYKDLTTSSAEVFTFSYVDARTVAPIWSEGVYGKNSLDPQRVLPYGDMMGRHRDDPTKTLAEFLAPHRNPLRQPSLRIAPIPRPHNGANFTITARMFDAANGTAAPANKTVEFELVPANALDVQRISGNTDDNGVASVMMHAPEHLSRALLRATVRKGDVIEASDSHLIFFRGPPGGTEIVLPPVILATRKQVIDALKPRPMIAPFAAPDSLTIVTDHGEITGPTDVVFDTDGKFRTELTAGTQAGLASIRIVNDTGQFVARAFTAIEAPLRVSITASPQPKLLTGAQITLSARVDLTESGLAAVGVPVTFSLSEQGATLMPATAVTNANGIAETVLVAGTMSKTLTVTATARLDNVPSSAALTAEIKAPCAGCPVTITSAAPGVVKGGTLQFESNQLVSWSATGGTISNTGLLTANQDGGVWRVTATSQENPGSVASREYIVQCDASDLAGTYMVVQDITVDTQGAGCGSSGMMTPGTVTVGPHAIDPQPHFVDIEYTWDLMEGCAANFGVNEIQFPPRIAELSCTASQTNNLGGCITSQISVSAIGPGVSGIAGHFRREFFINGTCVTGEDSTFTMMGAP